MWVFFNSSQWDSLVESCGARSGRGNITDWSLPIGFRVHPDGTKTGRQRVYSAPRAKLRLQSGGEETRHVQGQGDTLN